MKIGIVGLPNVGKSTLFQAITKKKVDISNYPFCTIDPNIGIAVVPDERLEKIADIIKPQKIVPAAIEFVDIAGLVKNAHKGEGLGNQFLSHIYAVDAILLVLRCFEDEKIIHVEKSIDPKRDFEIIKEELKLKDSSTGSEQALFTKPTINICNIKEGQKITQDRPWCDLEMDFKLELDASELSEEELKEFEIEPKLNELINLTYKTLGLITFYTIKGGEELRASSLKKGKTAPEAGGRVHSDFEKKFIRAEVVNYEKFLEVGGWSKAKEKGLLRTEGRDYIVQEGDIIEFKI